ncbi:hypothetical protein EHQ81_12090 [Leptospira selangorensis]|uniref:Porin n=1 Tax=Leptospira selangorensis TaxID=2484982 RepID=A0A5F2C591_9LEPT|nr:hypothetical protein [Leptospira selangorensis]TGM12987.1 hypothetical protein EHQ81_12090 [Leptospira selangorensis]TGM21261.1 hypothetical protein EHQ82_09655 [Leptospira selangorensis]
MKIKIFLLILILPAFSIFAQEIKVDDSKEKKSEKKLELILRRQFSMIDPLESNYFQERYPAYYGNVNNKTSATNFGFKYQIEKINSYFDFSMYELRKANLSKSIIYCGYTTPCSENSYNIGSYYRFESDFNIIKNLLSDKVGFGGGIRYVNSSLSLGFPNDYYLYVRSTSMGPQLSLRYKTPDWLGFSFGGKIDYFYLFGSFLVENTYTTDKSVLGFNRIYNQRPSTYIGKEYSIFFNYKATEDVSFTLGYSTIVATVTPTTKDVQSLDPNYDLRQNLRNNTEYGRHYQDRIFSTYLQVSIKI